VYFYVKFENKVRWGNLGTYLQLKFLIDTISTVLQLLSLGENISGYSDTFRIIRKQNMINKNPPVGREVK